VNTQLYSIIPYACAVVSTPCITYLSDRLGKRTLPLLGCLSTCILGFILVIATTQKAVLLAGCCLVAIGSYPGVVLGASYIILNQAGYTKRSTAWAMAQVFMQCYSIISTQVYIHPPRYFLGHGVLIGLNAVGVAALLVVYRIMARENKRSDELAAQCAAEGSALPGAEKSLEELCDYHPSFRYVL
jgi:MFS family permease